MYGFEHYTAFGPSMMGFDSANPEMHSASQPAMPLSIRLHALYHRRFFSS